MTTAYKFLAAGGVGLFSGVRWPQPAAHGPGAWVESDGHIDACVDGVHACRPRDLIHWIDDELWVVELDGDLAAHPTMVIAGRGRLVERVAAWDDRACADLADWAMERARAAARAVPGDAAHAADAGALADDLVALRAGGRPDGVAPRATGAPSPAAIAANIAFVSAHAAAFALSGTIGDDAYLAAFGGERDAQLAWLLHRTGIEV